MDCGSAYTTLNIPKPLHSTLGMRELYGVPIVPQVVSPQEIRWIYDALLTLFQCKHLKNDRLGLSQAVSYIHVLAKYLQKDFKVKGHLSFWTVKYFRYY